jgi:hypothetical protein
MSLPKADNQRTFIPFRRASLIVTTGRNNPAIKRGVAQTAKHFIDRGKLQEGMLNRVPALVRAYYPVPELLHTRGWQAGDRITTYD